MPLNKIKKYCWCCISLSELNKELGDLSFLENKDFSNGTKRGEFLENLLIGKLEDNSLVDTD